MHLKLDLEVDEAPAKKKPVRPPIFTMADLTTICKARTLEEAKQLALAAIELAGPHQTKPTLLKLEGFVIRAKTQQSLGVIVTNTILSHPSEGLKEV